MASCEPLVTLCHLSPCFLQPSCVSDMFVLLCGVATILSLFYSQGANSHEEFSVEAGKMAQQECVLYTHKNPSLNPRYPHIIQKGGYGCACYNLSIGRQRQADWFPGLPAQPALHTWQVFGERPFLKVIKRAVEEENWTSSFGLHIHR